MPSEYCTRIMPLGHPCGLKTSISRIKDNFSRLTHKSGHLNCSLTHDDFVSFFVFLTNKIKARRKCRFLSSFGSAQTPGKGGGTWVNFC